ncbi:hypothetical protein FKP32DRAFT_1758809 [Trametes sanguinea]|nr:hypothetical protein FKP32DRAFT_1758809 [Trametes sanguinea]
MVGEHQVCYTTIGGNPGAVYIGQRPPHTALGVYKLLLPIVVVTSSYSDGEAVLPIHFELSAVDPDDADALRQAIMESPTVDQCLAHVPHFFAIRYGRETGIYAGWPWREVEQFTVGFQGAKWSKCGTLREALLFMLEKPRTLPPLPRTPTPKKLSRFTSPPPLTKSTSLPTGRVSPSKHDSGFFAGHSSQAPPLIPAMKRSTSPLKHAFTSEAGGDRSAGIKNEDSDEDDALAAALRRSLDIPEVVPSHIQYLRQLFRPVGNPQADFEQLAVFLGARADAYLRGRGATDEELLTVFRAYIHSADVKEFSYSLGMKLKWPTRVTHELYRLIDIPPM